MSATTRAGGSGTPVRRGWPILAILLLAATVGPFVLWGGAIADWAAQALTDARAEPWRGAGIVTALLAGDIVLPVPSSAVSAFTCVTLGPAWGGATIWLGMMAGALAGYALGRSAGRFATLTLVGPAALARAEARFGRLGVPGLIVSRGVPVVAEAGILAAGAARMPLQRFIPAVAIGNALVSAGYALAARAALPLDGALLVTLLLVAGPVVGGALWLAFAGRG